MNHKVFHSSKAWRNKTANETEMTKEGAKCASGQLIMKICTTGVVKEPWVKRTGFVWVLVYIMSKLFPEDHWLHWLQTRPDSPGKMARALTSVPLLGLTGSKIGLTGPDMGFSCYSRKEGTAGLLIITLAKHISVNNLQKLKIWHKLRARDMKRFASILFSRALDWWKCPVDLWNTSFSMKYLDNIC